MHIDSITRLRKEEDLTAVTSVTVTAEDNYKSLDLLKGCINLERLTFYYFNWYDHHNQFFSPRSFPSFLYKMPFLNYLHFNGGSIPTLDYNISLLKGLKTLIISNCNYQKFPRDILSLEHLEELDLHNAGFLDVDFLRHNLDSLAQLKHLNLWKLVGKKLELDWNGFEHLKELIVPNSTYKYIQKNYPKIFSNVSYICQYSPAEKKHLNNLLTYCRKHRLDWSKRALLLNLLSNNKQQIKLLNPPELSILRATDILRFEVIRRHALEYYATTFEHKNLDFLKEKDTTITVLGKIGINKNELRQKLKELGIKYASKLSPTTTAVVLGQSSKGKYEEVRTKKIPIITEASLIAFLDQHLDLYLIEENDNNNHQLEQLSNLLRSNSEENILLALTLFKQGGFPKDLLTDLYIAYRQSDNRQIKNEAFRLLQQYGSANLITEAKQHYPIFSNFLSESSCSGRISRLCQDTELNGIAMAHWSIEHYNIGITYLLKKLPSDEKLLFLQQCCEEGKLNWAKKGIRSLPKELFHLKDLQHLDLSYNWSLKHIAKDIEKLNQLKTLNIKHCAIVKNMDKINLLIKWLPQTTIIWE